MTADLLCALASHLNGGPAVVKYLLQWLAIHPHEPRDYQLWLHERDSAVHTSLTDTPPPSILGISMVMVRIAEESPHAIAPHAPDIASSLAAWKSNQVDQWPRGHLARALAAVARQQLGPVVSVADDARTLFTDDADAVRYWGAQTILELYPHRLDLVSSTVCKELLNDPNPDVRRRGATLAIECLNAEIVKASAVVTDILEALPHDSVSRARSMLSVVAATARCNTEAVQPALSTLKEFLDAPLTATDAAVIFETVAQANPEAIDDAILPLVDCLLADTLTVRSAAVETLVAIGAVPESLLLTSQVK